MSKYCFVIGHHSNLDLFLPNNTSKSISSAFIALTMQRTCEGYLPNSLWRISYLGFEIIAKKKLKLDPAHQRSLKRKVHPMGPLKYYVAPYIILALKVNKNCHWRVPNECIFSFIFPSSRLLEGRECPYIMFVTKPSKGREDNE